MRDEHLRAWLYHNHHSLHNEDFAFWLDLASRQGNPVLELACGTGRLTIPLAQAGFEVTGVDHDTRMLAFLKDRITLDLSHRIALVQADATDFRFARRFSLVFLGCNTYSTLKADSRARTLLAVREQLLPEGIFAASMPNPVVIAGLPDYGELEIEEDFIHPWSGNPVQVSSEYTKDDECYRLKWHYDHLLPNGIVDRITMETTHTLASVDDYLAEVKRASLRTSAIFGDYDYSDYNQDSPYLILCLKSR
jgi:SAM-dependent methyltransferase